MEENREDIRLLKKIAKGSRSAFDRFYENYRAFVFQIAMHMTGSRMEAEDVSHDVFLEVYQKAGQYKASKGSVASWLAIRTKSRALDRLRKRKPLLRDHLEELLSGQEIGADKQFLSQLEKDIIIEALKHIPQEQREAIFRSYFQEETHKEIASSMNRPLGSVKSLIRYGLNNLRKQKQYSASLVPMGVRRMAFHDHIPEQVLIDCALGNLSEDKKTVVIRHTDECHSCRSILESWESLLSDMNEERSVQPPDTIKEKLDASLAKEDKKTAMKRKFKPAYLMGSAAAVLLLTAGLITTDGTRTVTNEKVVYNEAIHKAGIQEKPNTRQLEIIPVSRFDHVSGNIWINNTTGEMLVEIDGLFQLNDRHYQLWMIDENDDVKGEPLPIENGSVKVLYRGRDVQQFKRIKTSVEPPGGSDRPTGPETFTVDLEEGMSY